MCSEKDTKKDEKRGYFDNVADGVTINIKDIHITVTTLGPLKIDEPNLYSPPMLLVDIKNMKLQATNLNYEVVDLKQTRLYDKDRTQVTLFKLITCEDIVLSLSSVDMKSKMVLLKNLPLTIKVCTACNVGRD